MKRPNINYFLILFAAMAGLTACSSADDMNDQNYRGLNMTVSAVKLGGGIEDMEDANEANTRSLFIGGQTGSRFGSLWDDYDVAQVYYNGSLVGSLKPVKTGEERTTLSGTLTGSFSPGDVLTLYLPSPDMNYEGQDGTLGNMSRYYDYMSTTVAVASVDGSTVTTEQLAFVSKQTYLLLKFRDENDKLLHVKKLTVTAESGKIVSTKTLAGVTTYTNNLVVNTVKEASSVNDYPTDLYIAVLNEYSSADNYTFTVEATDGNTYKSKSVWNKKFNIGSFVIARRATLCATVDVEMSTGITPSESDDADVDVREITL